MSETKSDMFELNYKKKDGSRIEALLPSVAGDVIVELMDQNAKLEKENQELKERLEKMYGCECGRLFFLEDIDPDV